MIFIIYINIYNIYNIFSPYTLFKVKTNLFQRFKDNRSSRSQMLYKRGVFKIHRKAPVLESLFNRVACLRPPTPVALSKRDSSTGVFL